MTVEKVQRVYRKKPPGAFYLWHGRNITRIKQANPSVGTKAIVKLMSETWRNLDAEEKRSYLEEAKRSKEEFERVSKEEKQKQRNQKPALLPRLNSNDLVEELADVLKDPTRGKWTRKLLEEKQFHENRIRVLQTEIIKEQQSLLQINNKLIVEKVISRGIAAKNLTGQSICQSFLRPFIRL